MSAQASPVVDGDVSTLWTSWRASVVGNGLVIGYGTGARGIRPLLHEHASIRADDLHAICTLFVAHVEYQFVGYLAVLASHTFV